VVRLQPVAAVAAARAVRLVRRAVHRAPVWVRHEPHRRVHGVLGDHLGGGCGFQALGLRIGGLG